MAKIPSVTINVHNIEFNHGDQIVINLIEREEPKPEPQPAHRFKVGDRVTESFAGYGTGEILEIDSNDRSTPYRVKFDNDIVWLSERRIFIAPAPEPPKFYTGKVFAEKSTKNFVERDGKVFEFVNGFCVNKKPEDRMLMGEPISSLERLRENYSGTTWHEVKSDV